ncbi:MAG TPA: arylesterase [Rudaea sp.]
MRKLILSLFLLLSTALASAAERPILVLGDSLSAAYRIPPESGWVALLDARLKAQHHAREIVNASISGETTSGGLARLPALLSQHKPDLVLVELGANDALRGLPVEQIRANLDRILTACRDAGAKIVLVGIEIPLNYGAPYRDALRAMYRDVARQFNVPLVPFLLDGVALDPALMQDDGLHPRAEGEPKVLDNVWPVLKPVLGTAN